MRSAALQRWTGAFLFFFLAAASISCEETEYNSPLPGTLEVYLGVKNARESSILPWSGGATGLTFPVSQLIFRMTALEALQPGNLRLPVYADVRANKRNPDGDFYNLLSPQARDSSLVLGRVYAPPDTYTEIQIRGLILGNVTIVDTSSTAVFEVRTPNVLISDLIQLTGQSIEVQEGRTTRVTVTVDLDSTLQRRTEWFELHPKFYVSSVLIF